MMKFKSAPIIIPTLNRYEHLYRLLVSLEKCSMSDTLDVYIGLDYPPSVIYEDSYNRIKCVLQKFSSSFASFNVIERTENLGYWGNLNDLIDNVLEKYDRFIYADDDLEFSPNFLEYINKSLDKYADDENVIAIAGYSYPLKWNVSKSATLFKENYSCPMWGTAFWKHKFLQVREYMFSGNLINNAHTLFEERLLTSMLDVSRYEFMNLCFSPNADSLVYKVSDVSLRIYTILEDKMIVSPVLSKVRNWGFDGSGEYCRQIVINDKLAPTAQTYSYSNQIIDTSNHFIIIEDTLMSIDENRHILDCFDKLSKVKKIKMYIKVLLYILLGKKLYQIIFGK